MYAPVGFREDPVAVLRATVADIIFGAPVTRTDDSPVVTYVPMMLTGPDDAPVRTEG